MCKITTRLPRYGKVSSGETLKVGHFPFNAQQKYHKYSIEVQVEWLPTAPTVLQLSIVHVACFVALSSC